LGPLKILEEALDFSTSATSNLVKMHPESNNRVWMGLTVGLAIVLTVAVTLVKKLFQAAFAKT
jgi:hypothetical protein